MAAMNISYARPFQINLSKVVLRILEFIKHTRLLNEPEFQVLALPLEWILIF
jgi:hypothetical protein